MSSAASLIFNEGSFIDQFDGLKSLIREEWPQVEADALDATGGEPAAVIALVAEQTEHTRALIRSQLGELQHVLVLQGGGAKRLEKAVQRLEERVDDFTHRVKDEWAPAARERVAGAKERATHTREEVESTVHDHVLASLLIAVGFGWLLGLLVGGLSRGR